MSRRAAVGVALLLLPLTADARAEVYRLEGRLADETAIIEIHGLERTAADVAARAAWQALAEAPGLLRALERAFVDAAGGRVAPGDERWELLVRADAFCRWSEGVVSPLGGRVLRAWGVRHPAPGRPSPDVLADAAASARCDRLALDPAERTVRAASGSEVDLMPFELGWAVDRAVDAARAAGADNLHVRLGGVERGVGAGPHGSGWRVELPRLPGAAAPLEPVLLRDQALALLRADDRPIRLGGDPLPRWLDQRHGRVAGGVLATAALTELAVDAQPLAWTMFALGAGAGQMRLGSLRGDPGVLWALGSGAGEPVLAVVHWSTIGTD